MWVGERAEGAPRRRQSGAFYLVGVVNTLVDVGPFAARVRLAGVPYLVAQVLAYGSGACLSYTVNHRVAFRLRGLGNWRKARRPGAANLASLAAASLVLVGVHVDVRLGLLGDKAVSLVVGGQP